MPSTNFRILALVAMIAFAGNSLLCRFALKQTAMDPASFTCIRILSGAAALWLLMRARGARSTVTGSWTSAAALFVYAAAFSFAYVTLPAGVGALLLFGAVQVTMIGYGLWSGERMSARRSLGYLLAVGGLVWLMRPSATAPPVRGSLLMIAAGISWGVYSLRGRGVGDPAAATAGNFLRAALPALFLPGVAPPSAGIDAAGISAAVASGTLASGAGYYVWYGALRGLNATTASIVQLSVPVIAAIGGIVFLGEPITVQVLMASAAVLGGIAMSVAERPIGARTAR